MENFFENIWQLLKANFPWVLIAFGVLEIVGNVLDWDWIVRPTGKLKNTVIYMFFEGNWGRKCCVNFFYILLPKHNHSISKIDS